MAYERKFKIGKPILEVNNISLSFGGVKAITDTSFNVLEHEVRAIIGPNGAGKSTTIGIIGTLVTKTSGTVKIFNHDIDKNVSIAIEFSSKKKNKFIKSFSKLNPVTTFQNELNAIAETDFYAYKDYRTRIQDMIDKKIELILEDTWNNVIVDKNRYTEYVKNFE